ncbi:PhoD-like phosphatase [Prauserella aidingensis]|uniref:alkaline phosphatase D family protein n=1 Tax=Prauserella aidingensis TaxID=387890 RepID=UPI0020A45417|nr:alkaline phosphatase D family protein [Prauserella aidingensis]MCP2251897.1 PhoD-like phosphatase [Prauserella aidingensis]
MTAQLLLGPLLRHVGETTATVWVETDSACEVDVLGNTARTFEVYGHHYALVVVRGLRPGTSTPYEVRLDGQRAWPEPDSALPAGRIRTLGADGTFRLVFGSCRRPGHERGIGSDALIAYARRMTELAESDWPQALLLLGDQVYADEPTAETKEWLGNRRDLRTPPGVEVTDFHEYAHLYYESWTEPLLRWLLSTVPTSMIFDDHDVRDDWNTSRAWREQMWKKPWWPERIQDALVSYWVYQHLGNLGPDELADDEIFAAVTGHDGDAAPLLREFARRADADSTSVRWSYRRDFGRIRLLMIDTRAGRMLEPGERSMVDDDEFSWIEENTDGEFDHLLLGSSLPWLLPHSISDGESINERACEKPGLRGRWAEVLRQALDMEHWAAFRKSFDRLARLVRRVSSRDDAPASVTVLSGDVHHHYAAEATFAEPVRSRVHQLTCSPVHNEAPPYIAWGFRIAWWRPLAAVMRRWARRAGVAPADVEWDRVWGPHLPNAVATVEIDGRESRAIYERADGDELVTATRLPLTAPADRSSR